MGTSAHEGSGKGLEIGGSARGASTPRGRGINTAGMGLNGAVLTRVLKKCLDHWPAPGCLPGVLARASLCQNRAIRRGPAGFAKTPTCRGHIAEDAL
jgi:hypothetical protein